MGCELAVRWKSPEVFHQAGRGVDPGGEKSFDYEHRTGLLKGTMKTMTWRKLKFAAGVGLAVWLAGGAATVGLASDEAGDSLPASEILKRAEAKYASLTSYSDEGKVVATLNGITSTHTFTLKLDRQDRYRIEWEHSSESTGFNATNKGAVWSAGNGDFLDTGSGAQPQASRELALSSATGISGGAAATIPGTFFKLNWGDQLGGSAQNGKKQPDEKIGGADCYVLTSEVKGRTKTLWIGKQDFLIHQTRVVTSAEAIKAALAEAAKRNPEISAVRPKFDPQGITSTETHANIVLNKQFTQADFTR